MLGVRVVCAGMQTQDSCSMLAGQAPVVPLLSPPRGVAMCALAAVPSAGPEIHPVYVSDPLPKWSFFSGIWMHSHVSAAHPVFLWYTNIDGYY